jgi:hypothetical protein
MIRRKISALMIALAMTLGTYAQEQKFSPEKFDADMTAFVTREAGFTQQEADKFFPLFNEMHQKQRAVYGRIRTATKQKPADDDACAKVVKECDKLNVELKEIEQTYHQKMLKVVPATKVYDAIRAEARFHRQMMKGWQRHDKRSKGQPKDKRR